MILQGWVSEFVAFIGASTCGLDCFYLISCKKQTPTRTQRWENVSWMRNRSRQVSRTTQDSFTSMPKRTTSVPETMEKPHRLSFRLAYAICTLLPGTRRRLYELLVFWKVTKDQMGPNEFGKSYKWTENGCV
ncbi:hypothetical protein Bca101_054978 [Brassica carinata]